MLRRIVSLMALIPAAVLLLASSPAEARLQRVYNPEPIQVPAGKSLVQVRKAIRKAVFDKGWEAKEISPTEMDAKYTKPGRGKEYSAVVTIAYNTKTVRISYKDSKHLDYKKSKNRIHPTYNRWVQFLERNIRADLGAY
ncbi:MAG: hypothetical protein ACYDDO_02390 [Acidiferrobacterales bacterium]